MKFFIAILISIAAFLKTDAQNTALYSTNSGTIIFQSDAPNELINAKSTQLAGIVDIAKKTYAFKVPINSFEGFNSPLQKEHFNENYLESKKYPEASFTGKIIEDIDFTQNGQHTVRAKGYLTIHGIKQERIIKSEMVIKDGKMSIFSKFTILLSDHEIPIPKVVKDKLSDVINVDVNCQLTPR